MPSTGIDKRLGIVEAKTDIIMGSLKEIADEQKKILKVLNRNTTVVNGGILIGVLGIGAIVDFFARHLLKGQ